MIKIRNLLYSIVTYWLKFYDTFHEEFRSILSKCKNNDIIKLLLDVGKNITCTSNDIRTISTLTNFIECFDNFAEAVFNSINQTNPTSSAVWPVIAKNFEDIVNEFAILTNRP